MELYYGIILWNYITGSYHGIGYRMVWTPVRKAYFFHRLSFDWFFNWIISYGLKNDQFFWREKWSSFIWIQPAAQELIISLILNWKMIKFHMNPAWSSRTHCLIDSQLKINQIWNESSLGDRIHPNVILLFLTFVCIFAFKQPDN